MCVMSMIGDHYQDRFTKFLQPGPLPLPGQTVVLAQVSREEFNALKAEVENMKELLRRAKIYDEEHGEPDCDTDEKFELLRKIADAVGVNLEEVLAKKRK